MKPILVLYASTEGWTGRVAERIGARLGEVGGLQVEIVLASALPAGFDLAGYGAAVVAGSLHFGKHQEQLVAFVRANAAALAMIPGALVTVSLSEATLHRPGVSPETRGKAAAELERCEQAFRLATGWAPGERKSVAGALLYTRYGWFTRLAMRFIARLSGASQDTSRDHVYTDWDDLDAWARSFAAALTGASVDRPPAASRHLHA